MQSNKDAALALLLKTEFRFLTNTDLHFVKMIVVSDILWTFWPGGILTDYAARGIIYYIRYIDSVQKQIA